MYTEQLSILVNFIQEAGTQEIKKHFLYTNADLYYIKSNIECVSEIVRIAGEINKQIQSVIIAEAIEEISSVWEVSK